MDALIKRLGRWEELKREHAALVHQRRRREVESAVEEAKRTRDVGMLLRILSTDADKCPDVEAFLSGELRRAIAFNSKERISTIAECMCALGLPLEGYKLMVVDHLENLCARMGPGPTAARMEEISRLREYDKRNMLGIHEYAERKVDEEAKRCVESMPTQGAKELDKWLNDVAGICRYRPWVVETYKNAEVRYFSMCLGIIGLGDKVSAVEDAVYLVGKIRRRSSRAGVCVDNEMMGKLNEHGMLCEKEVRGLFEERGQESIGD